MQFLKAGLRVLAPAVSCCIGTGCGISRDVGLAERCAEVMRLAYPSATFEITKRAASATSFTTVVATVEAVRTDVAPAGASVQDWAVECSFDENVLTSFRWTAGPTR